MAPSAAAAPALRDTAAVKAAIKEGFSRETVRLADRVHLVWCGRGSTDGPFEGNTVVVEQKDGLVVLDAGGAPASGAGIVEQIKRLSTKPVRYLIYSHYHGDHNLGAGEFLKAWPAATIISTEATRQNMLSHAMDYIKTYGKDHEAMVAFATKEKDNPALPEAVRAHWATAARRGLGMIEAYTGLKAYPAELTFSDRLTLHDDEAPVEIAFLGKANTDGDAVVWLPKQRVLATGDIVVSPVPYASASYPGDWIAVLQKLKAYDFAVLVPGHGGVQKDRAYLDKLIAALTDIRTRVGPLAADKLSVDEIRKRFDEEPLLQAFAGDDRWDRVQMKGFFLNAIVSNAVKEARGDAIVQGHDGG